MRYATEITIIVLIACILWIVWLGMSAVINSNFEPHSEELTKKIDLADECLSLVMKDRWLSERYTEVPWTTFGHFENKAYAIEITRAKSLDKAEGVKSRIEKLESALEQEQKLLEDLN